MNDFCFLDLETTGFSPEKDSIIEISFIRIKGGKEITRFDQVSIPDKSPLTAFISSLTGISPEEIEKEGKNLADLKSEILEKIGDSIIVGHNIDFDINFLVANGIDVSKNPRIDTHELARILLPGEESFALEVLSKKYGFLHKEAHRAMSDVEACVELFAMLEEKIKNLPPDFFTEIKPFLENKTDWYAKDLFLKSAGNPDFIFEKKEEIVEPEKKEIDPSFWEKYKNLTPEKSIFWRIKDSVPASQAMLSVAEKIAEKKSVLIISPKLNFFPGVKKFPTPGVIFDPEKLQTFAENREKLDDKETTFYLKCAFRHHLGLRGYDFFDLAGYEGTFWREVCLDDPDHPIFQEIVAERKDEKIMVLTPMAFFRFHDLEIFKDRVLIIDEAEQFTEEMLKSPTETVSLSPLLNAKEESVANKTLFFIRDFVREVIEKKLNHAIGPFPERMRLLPKEGYPEFANLLREIDSENEKLNFAAEILEGTETQGTVRWINYFPDNGNLNLNLWRFTDWDHLKKALNNFPKIICHRHGIGANANELFQTFIGTKDGFFFEDEALFSEKKLVIAKDVISANNPGFNTFCGERIVEIVQKELNPKDHMIVNFSSQEAARNVYDQLTESLKEENIELLGERINGGEGKILELLKQKQETILITQRLIHPDLENYKWKIIVAQKFPFNPPSPLLEAVEESMKIAGKNFWSSWTIPQVAANLSRRTSIFSNAKKIIFLDPRENTRWGKEILERAF